MSQKILLTGASGGFGVLTTHALLRKGHAVAATMRDTAGKNKAKAEALAAAGAHVVELDVTDEQSVNRGVVAAVEVLGGLDAVVNNAGVGVLGLQESFTTEDLQRLFDVNVFGVQRVNRAVLPHFRGAGHGLLLHVSSCLGRIALPFYGPYNASKWALEAMAENYRMELSAFGVDSVIVEPGGYPTTFMDSLLRPSDRERDAGYGALADMPQQMFDGFEGALAQNPAQDPQNVADAIVGLIETPAGQRPVRTVVDRMGMGDAIGPYNEQLERIHEGLLGAFGMGDMMRIKA